MQRCNNCYHSLICYKYDKARYDKHHNEDECTCLSWTDDSVDYDEEDE